MMSQPNMISMLVKKRKYTKKTYNYEISFLCQTSTDTENCPTGKSISIHYKDRQKYISLDSRSCRFYFKENHPQWKFNA